MPRIRELGITIGELPTGKQNAITDVTGVLVGHTTLIEGEGKLVPGRGPVRTGVTVIRPHGGNLFREKVRAAAYTLNGYGKVAGFEQVRELGTLEAPIALTNTLNVGRVLDALIDYTIRQSPEIGIHTSSINIVVGETNDGFLNDLQGRHVRSEHVLAALDEAGSGPVQEGSAGAGTGTCCLGWKGGIGTSSRVLPPEQGGFTLGVLVQSNFGRAGDLVVAGVPAGRLEPPLAPAASPSEPADAGSVMVVLATDAPLSSLQLQRVAQRAGAGLARTGSHWSHGSGDFAIAFTTARRIPHAPPALLTTETVLAQEEPVMNAIFRATIESVEEAVLNSLTSSQTMTGRDGNTVYGLPWEELKGLFYPER